MGPPKIRLHTNNSSGKLKSISKTNIPHASASQPGPSTSSGSVTTPAATENDQQFELEIVWCVQQLQTTLTAANLNQKQAQDTEKNIKILKNPAQPIIKKRQLMRQLFGDYRSKMAEEEQKLYSANRRIQFNANTKPNKKSHFVKKSALLSALKSQQEFQFNFKLDDKLSGLNLNESDDIVVVNSNVPSSNNSENACSSSSVQENTSKFQLSGNEFRFNFSAGDENQNAK